MPGSEEAILYPGDYHYLAGALLHTAKPGIPLVNDMPGLPVPLISDGADGDKAKQLSAMLAIECVRLALPELPLLRPEDLMEFRADNNAALRGFRRSMLRYAGDLNGKVANVPPAEIQAATKFFVDTEIVPALDELRAKMNAPARPLPTALPGRYPFKKEGRGDARPAVPKGDTPLKTFTAVALAAALISSQAQAAFQVGWNKLYFANCLTLTRATIVPDVLWPAQVAGIYWRSICPDLDNRNRQLGVLRLTDATIAQSFSKN